jgi:hypothetical protein
MDSIKALVVEKLAKIDCEIALFKNELNMINAKFLIDGQRGLAWLESLSNQREELVEDYKELLRLEIQIGLIPEIKSKNKGAL